MNAFEMSAIWTVRAIFIVKIAQFCDCPGEDISSGTFGRRLIPLRIRYFG